MHLILYHVIIFFVDFLQIPFYLPFPFIVFVYFKNVSARHVGLTWQPFRRTVQLNFRPYWGRHLTVWSSSSYVRLSLPHYYLSYNNNKIHRKIIPIIFSRTHSVSHFSFVHNPRAMPCRLKKLFFFTCITANFDFKVYLLSQMARKASISLPSKLLSIGLKTSIWCPRWKLHIPSFLSPPFLLDFQQNQHMPSSSTCSRIPG